LTPEEIQLGRKPHVQRILDAPIRPKAELPMDQQK